MFISMKPWFYTNMSMCFLQVFLKLVNVTVFIVQKNAVSFYSLKIWY